MRVVLLAGEASGDLLGGAVVAALRQQDPTVECLGVTGPRMREAGCDSIGDIDSLSVMGLVEVLRVLPRILRFRRALRQRVPALRPDVVVGIDAPDFNLPLEAVFRRQGLRTVHVVSPTIWAWRPKRRFGIARAADAVLCLYPFEPDCYADTTVRAEFIGHPLADELDDGVGARDARVALGLDPDVPVLGVLPGSRRGEVSRLMPSFAAAARALAAQHPGLRAVVPVAHAGLRDLVEAAVRSAPEVDWQLLDGASRQAMRAADLLLVASGTVTLEALLLGRPMVVSYRTSPMTAFLLRHLRLLQTDFVSLPNILGQGPIVPELLQEAATPAALCAALDALWRSPSARQQQLDRFSDIRARLRQDAAARAAAVIAELAARS